MLEPYYLVTVADRSEFVVDGGRIEYGSLSPAISAESDSRVMLQSGHIDSPGLRVRDSELQIAGGTLVNTGNDFAPGTMDVVNSTVKVTGGEIRSGIGYFWEGGM